MDLTNKIEKIDKIFDNLNIEDFEEILVKAGIEDVDSHTLADCIEIVKCKDCIHSKKHVSIIQDDGNIKHYYRLCKLMYPDTGFNDDDYCDCGVKKKVKRGDDIVDNSDMTLEDIILYLNDKMSIDDMDIESMTLKEILELLED